MAEHYPVWLGGQDITADLLNAGIPKVIRKTADTSRASTTSQTADPELSISLEANAVYVWDGWLKYFADPAADLVVDFTAPTGTLGEWVAFGAGSGTGATGTTGYSIRTETNDITQQRNYYGTTTETHGLLMKGTIRTSTTAGTFSLDWAQGTSSATATVLYTDSWLRFQRIA